MNPFVCWHIHKNHVCIIDFLCRWHSQFHETLFTAIRHMKAAICHAEFCFCIIWKTLERHHSFAYIWSAAFRAFRQTCNLHTTNLTEQLRNLSTTVFYIIWPNECHLCLSSFTRNERKKSD